MEFMSRGSCQGVLLMLMVSEIWKRVVGKARGWYILYAYKCWAFWVFPPGFPSSRVGFSDDNHCNEGEQPLGSAAFIGLLCVFKPSSIPTT